MQAHFYEADLWLAAKVQTLNLSSAAGPPIALTLNCATLMFLLWVKGARFERVTMRICSRTDWQLESQGYNVWPKHLLSTHTIANDVFQSGAVQTVRTPHMGA